VLSEYLYYKTKITYRFSILLTVEGDKGKTFAGVVDIGHDTKLLKFSLKSSVYAPAKFE